MIIILPTGNFELITVENGNITSQNSISVKENEHAELTITENYVANYNVIIKRLTLS